MNITLSEILQELPPGTYKNVSDVLKMTRKGWSDDEIIALQTPDLYLHCDLCNGVRLFEHNEFPLHYNIVEIGSNETWSDHCYVEYLCQNCKEETKGYFLVLLFDEENIEDVNVIKVGEYPFYGPKISSKLISIIGPDRELFLKGRRCESQNLGIASYSYYRRVVENQRNRLIDNIISVCQKTNKEQKIIDGLIQAKENIQFSSSLDSIKDLLPKELYIKNVNPLKLLHKALSIGIHNLNDKECLEYAQSIRLVLTEFADRLNELLNDHNELNEAIERLNKLK
ncbi:hypothetical protein [Thalassobellus citreus]|uniref:hypothetical protein n=1 Tax=Thalassobellus citreus TaxID=3367752 RepID=UPI0037BDBBF9